MSDILFVVKIQNDTAKTVASRRTAHRLHSGNARVGRIFSPRVFAQELRAHNVTINIRMAQETIIIMERCARTDADEQRNFISLIIY